MGAVAYLSKSEYGKHDVEVYPNNAETYETGCSANDATQVTSPTCLNTYESPKGVEASTTGTIYGVYDMSGGNWERVAAYVNNEHSNLNGNCLSIMNALGKYKDIYELGESDNREENYAKAKNKKGDAVYETSSKAVAAGDGWNSDSTRMPHAFELWFIRGGYFARNSGAGPFAFYNITGAARSYDGFRPVLLVGKGL